MNLSTRQVSGTATRINVTDANSTATALITVFDAPRNLYTNERYVPIGRGPHPTRLILHMLTRGDSADRGIGRRMFRAAVEWALANKKIIGASRVSLEASGEVNGSFASLIGLYERLSFLPVAIFTSDPVRVQRLIADYEAGHRLTDAAIDESDIVAVVMETTAAELLRAAPN